MYKQIITAILILAQINTFSQTINIGERTLHFKDTRRNRPLTTEVWYPTTDILKPADKYTSPFLRMNTVRDGRIAARKLPLIMISHGSGGDRLSLEWLAQFLALHGYMVAAVDHWGNTYDNKIPIEFIKAWERPQDISFVITQLLSDPVFKKVIDARKIGAVGFSFGGSTMIELAGGIADYPALLNYYRTTGRKEVEVPELPGLVALLSDSAFVAQTRHVPVLKDSRIKAFIAISPSMGTGFSNKSQFKNVNGAVLIIGSNADVMNPVKLNSRNYHYLITGSEYYEFPGKTGHYVMLAEANDKIKKEVPAVFMDDPSVNRHQVHLTVDSLALDFFRRKL
jgi:predicted dienelactone hydrolase